MIELLGLASSRRARATSDTNSEGSLSELYIAHQISLVGTVLFLASRGGGFGAVGA